MSDNYDPANPTGTGESGGRSRRKLRQSRFQPAEGGEVKSQLGRPTATDKVMEPIKQNRRTLGIVLKPLPESVTLAGGRTLSPANDPASTGKISFQLKSTQKLVPTKKLIKPPPPKQPMKPLVQYSDEDSSEGDTTEENKTAKDSNKLPKLELSELYESTNKELEIQSEKNVDRVTRQSSRLSGGTDNDVKEKEETSSRSRKSESKTERYDDGKDHEHSRSDRRSRRDRSEERDDHKSRHDRRSEERGSGSRRSRKGRRSEERSHSDRRSRHGRRKKKKVPTATLR